MINDMLKKVVKIIKCREPKRAPRTGRTAKTRRTFDPHSSSIIVAKSSGRQRKAS